MEIRAAVRSFPQDITGGRVPVIDNSGFIKMLKMEGRADRN